MTALDMQMDEILSHDGSLDYYFPCTNTQSQHPRHRIATLQNESPGTFADTGPLVGKSKSESWLGRINQHGR